MFDSFSHISPGIPNDLNVSFPRASTRVCPSQTSFTIFQVLTQTTSKITEHGHIQIHLQIHRHVRSHISQKKCVNVHICVIMNRQRTPQNGLVWVQTGHSTGTCTATLCVIEVRTHQKLESFKKKSAARKIEFESAN